MKKLILRYKYFLVLLTADLIFLQFMPEIGKKSFLLTGNLFLEMASIIPPIFILLGLLDVWVERESLIKYMGEDAGLLGGLIAFLMGSIAAGPLYVAFPITSVLLKKGAKLLNVFIFMGAWSSTKIPFLLFETSSLGITYMLVRLFGSIIGISIISMVLDKTTSQEEKSSLYARAQDFQ
jgi:uncharacterized membrane protein YraQ (UPF0718 family)